MSEVKFCLNPRKKHFTNKKYEVVRISGEAYNALVDMANESTFSMMNIASKAILFAHDKVSYEEGEDDNG